MTAIAGIRTPRPARLVGPEDRGKARLRFAASLVAVLATTAALIALGILPGTALGADASGSNAVTVTPLQAALIGLGYYFSFSPWWFGANFFTFYRPLVAGLCVGIILGDPAEGALIGAAINLFYLGFIAAGGSIPSDPSLAGWLGTTIAIAGGLSYGEALALAVPLGLLGTVVFYTRMTVDSVFVHIADRYAERGWLTGLTLANVVYPQIFLFFLAAVPVFLATLNGVPFIVDLIHSLPVWVIAGLAVAGGVLPAIGIAMNMRFIFRWPFSPYFFLGFFLVIASDRSLPIVVIGAIGLAVAALHVVFTTSPAPEPATGRDARVTPPPPPASEPAATERPGAETTGAGAATDAAPAPDARRLSRVDVHRAWLLWTFFAHANYNYERLQATGFAHGMAPVIRRLYSAPEDIKAAMRRHLVFYNTSPEFGGAINGAVIAMEEQRASGAQIDDDAINSVKTGLMGPVAGIGDTITQGTVTPLLLALGISITGVPTVVNGQPPDLVSVTGNPLGPIVYLVLMTTFLLVVGYVFFMQGYARGRGLIVDVLRDGRLGQLVAGASVLGNLVLGALGATYVSLWMAPTVTIGSAYLDLQRDLIDKVLPGMLPLALILGTWWLLRRRVSPMLLLVVYLAAAIIGSYPFFGEAPQYVTDKCGSALFQPYGPCPEPSPSPSPVTQ
jgi:mannose/fructose/N-acetylgalactosamine-specific phosphotransferase system component IID/mannose/fructose/N-acetylgalactosamine-specific phosphotransferase system component IIC